MKLSNDQRGFVLSGIALLLVLPAMLLAASLLATVEAGGETASLQAVSDKVSYTGHDIERMINYMGNNKIPTDNFVLSALAENYRADTGLLVDIGLHPLRIEVKQTGAVHWAGTKYCWVDEVVPGKWRYRFEDLDEELGESADWDYNEPILLVERIDDGKLRITIEEHYAAYLLDIYYSDQKLWDDAGGPGNAHLGENKEVDEVLQLSMDKVSELNSVIVYVRDPRSAAQYTSTVYIKPKLLTRFQDFEVGNGTPGNYFIDVWRSTSSFETSIVHDGERSVEMNVPAPAGGANGGTIRIYAASPSGYMDMSEARTFFVWVYDTQGNNTIQLRLKDSDGDGGSGGDGYYLWSSMTSQKNQWTEITWQLSQYPNVPNLNWDRIARVELYEWWDGTYYFDDLAFT